MWGRCSCWKVDEIIRKDYSNMELKSLANIFPEIKFDIISWYLRNLQEQGGDMKLYENCKVLWWKLIELVIIQGYILSNL